VAFTATSPAAFIYRTVRLKGYCTCCEDPRNIFVGSIPSGYASLERALYMVCLERAALGVAKAYCLQMVVLKDTSPARSTSPPGRTIPNMPSSRRGPTEEVPLTSGYPCSASSRKQRAKGGEPGDLQPGSLRACTVHKKRGSYSTMHWSSCGAIQVAQVVTDSERRIAKMRRLNFVGWFVRRRLFLVFVSVPCCWLLGHSVPRATSQARFRTTSHTSFDREDACCSLDSM
jgi:hypothetical protein